MKNVKGIKRKQFSVILLTVFIGFILGSSPAIAKPKKLKVGVILPLSGPLSVVGLGLARGFELYFDKVNDEGGITIKGKTYTIQMIAEDSKMDPAVASTAAKKLAYRDKVKYIFGAITPPASSAIYQVCAKARILHMISWLDAPGMEGDVSQKKPYAVRTTISSDAGWELDYETLKKVYPDAKNVYWVVPDSGIQYERALDVASSYGFDTIGYTIWSLGTVDFMPYLTRALAAKPDLIHSIGSAQSADMLRTARQMGYKGIFVSDSPLAPDLIRMIAGKEAAYDVVCNGIDFAHATPGMKESMDRWKAKYNEPYFPDVPVTWSQAEVFIQVLKKTNSFDAKKFVSTFESLTEPGSLSTAFGPGHTGGKDRFGVDRVVVRPVPVSRLVDGQIFFEGYKQPVIE